MFNSVEGLTQMWDLQSGEIVGKFESYARPTSGQLEPCMWPLIYLLCFLLTDYERSLVCIFAPQSYHIYLLRWLRKRPHSFHRTCHIWPTSSHTFDWSRQVWALLYLCTSDVSMHTVSQDFDRGFSFGCRVLTATGSPWHWKQARYSSSTLRCWN